jgi:hypothetical protein
MGLRLLLSQPWYRRQTPISPQDDGLSRAHLVREGFLRAVTRVCGPGIDDSSQYVVCLVVRWMKNCWRGRTLLVEFDSLQWSL